MTGPEHCREAERLQVHAQESLTAGVYDAEESLQRAAAVLADAQVHALHGSRDQDRRERGPRDYR